MVKKILLLVVLIVCSCQNKDKNIDPLSQRTERQKQLAKWYTTAVSLRNFNHFPILNYADSIKKFSSDEHPDYQALGFICYGTYFKVINNAMKYAEANQIAVNVMQQSNQININIQEDGKDFDLKSVDLGNGISNMKKRIADIGGDFAMRSELNNGTSNSIKINKKNG